MKKRLNILMKYIERYHASDIHFTLRNHVLETSVRGIYGIENIKNKRLDENLFHYLKYISNLDLGNSTLPQSGHFNFVYKGKELQFRFAFLHTLQLQSAVLRVLDNHKKIEIENLSLDNYVNKTFYQWTKFRSGLVLISGPTGSGKSTTLHALLHEISKQNKLKVITLEDPIEIQTDAYLQLQINERMDFTYEEGIRQLLRHDPDVIMIGEVRDERTAKSLVRCALSGHMVFTTIHAKSAKEAIKRLVDFGIPHNDLKEVLSGVTNQRIYPKLNEKERICIYEILQEEELKHVLQFQEYSTKHNDLQKKLTSAIRKKWISKEQAKQDFKF